VRLSVPVGGGFSTPYPFSYDALGRPAQRGTLATLTYRYVGTSPVSYATVPSAGSATYGLLDADGSRLALHTGGTTAWTSFDLHGNLVGATASDSGTIVSALRYDAYGATLDAYTAGSGATETPWRYQGRLDLSPDADEPLYDYGARRYRPSLGAFTALDTYPGSAADPRSMNRYLYAHANPTTLIDPTGHCVRIDGNRCLPTQTPKPPPPAPKPPPKSKVSPPPLLPDDVLTPVSTKSPGSKGLTSSVTVTATGHPQFGQASVLTVTPPDAGPFGWLTSDELRMGLDGCGLWTLLGTFCDIGSMFSYGIEGDLGGVAFSALAVLPLLSEGVGGGRLGARFGDELVEAGVGIRVGPGGRQADNLGVPASCRSNSFTAGTWC